MLEQLEQINIADITQFILQLSFLAIGISAIVGFTLKKLMQFLFKF